MRRRYDRNIRMEMGPDRIRIGVDVNQRLRRRRLSRKPKSQRRQGAEPRSDRNDQIRSLKELNMRWRSEEAKLPNPEPVIVRKLILHLEGGCDRPVPALAERNQVLAKFRSSTLSSDQQNGSLRLAKQGGRLLHGGATGLGSRDAVNPGGEQTGLHLENVLRKLDHNRPGRAAEGPGKSARHHLGHLV